MLALPSSIASFICATCSLHCVTSMPLLLSLTHPTFILSGGYLRRNPKSSTSLSYTLHCLPLLVSSPFPIARRSDPWPMALAVPSLLSPSMALSGSASLPLGDTSASYLLHGRRGMDPSASRGPLLGSRQSRPSASFEIIRLLIDG